MSYLLLTVLKLLGNSDTEATGGKVKFTVVLRKHISVMLVISEVCFQFLITKTKLEY